MDILGLQIITPLLNGVKPFFSVYKCLVYPLNAIDFFDLSIIELIWEFNSLFKDSYLLDKGIIKQKSLRLLPNEKVYSKLDGVWNLSSDQGNLGTFFVTNVRAVWHANLAENFSISELVDSCLSKNKTKIIKILNENSFNSEDCIIILRTFLIKLKRLIRLHEELNSNDKNIDGIITSFKPPIFWKEKEIVKQQVNKLDPAEITKLIIKINEIELQIKKNNSNPINIVSDFILNQSLVTN